MTDSNQQLSAGQEAAGRRARGEARATQGARQASEAATPDGVKRLAFGEGGGGDAPSKEPGGLGGQGEGDGRQRSSRDGDRPAQGGTGEAGGSEGANAAGVEPDEPPTRALLGILVVLAGTVLGVGVVLWQVFGLTAQEEIGAKDLRVESQELLELRARDQGRLTQYEQLEAGAYQIPIERAMEKLLREPARIAPLREVDAGSEAGEQDGGGLEGRAEAGREQGASEAQTGAGGGSASGAGRGEREKPPEERRGAP